MADFRIAAAAQADIFDVISYTEQTFGDLVSRRYEALLKQAILDVAAEPHRQGSIARPELYAGAYTYHLRHSRYRAQSQAGLIRNPRHFLVYRLVHPDLIEILRLLHDAMELQRHFPGDPP